MLYNLYGSIDTKEVIIVSGYGIENPENFNKPRHLHHYSNIFYSFRNIQALK